MGGGRSDVVPEQIMQIRLLFAEDMVKKQFVAKTMEVLKDFCLVCQPEMHPAQGADHDCGSVPYHVFEKWVSAYKTESFVVSFK